MSLNTPNINTYEGANTYLPPSPVNPLTALISNISNTNPMVITIEDNPPSNVYVQGQLIYLSVPFSYGMYQANGLTAEIISINGNELTASINALQFDPFTSPPSNSEQPATIAPAGGRNTYNFTTLPFHSENGMAGN